MGLVWQGRGACEGKEQGQDLNMHVEGTVRILSDERQGQIFSCMNVQEPDLRLCQSGCFSRAASWGWDKTEFWTSHSVPFCFTSPTGHGDTYFLPLQIGIWVSWGHGRLFYSLLYSQHSEHLAHNKFLINTCWASTKRRKKNVPFFFFFNFKEGSWCYLKIHHLEVLNFWFATW